MGNNGDSGEDQKPPYEQPGTSGYIKNKINEKKQICNTETAMRKEK